MSVIERLRVIGIAVSSIEKSARFYEDVLGLERVWSGDYPENPIQAKVVKYVIGEVALNLMEPTDPDSAVARFIRKRGEGLFSLVLAIRPGGLDQLASKGLKEAFPKRTVMRDADFGPGEHYSEATITWNDPRGTGVLFELQELVRAAR